MDIEAQREPSAQFTEAVIEDRPIDLYGDRLRGFTSIDDIVNDIILALDRPRSDDGQQKPGGFTTPHRLYNIGNNRPEQLMHLIEAIERACGRKAQIKLLVVRDGDVYQTFPAWAISVAMGFAPTRPISVGIPAFVEWHQSHKSGAGSS